MFDSNDPDLISKLLDQSKYLKKERSLIDKNIEPWLKKLDANSYSLIERKQKKKEIEELGHFLYHFDKEIVIEEVFTESPDFIVKSYGNLIGIELKDFITNEFEKEKEGLLKLIFNSVIDNLENNLVKYKGNYRVEFIEENFSLKRKNRKLIEKEIISIIEGCNKTPGVVKSITKFPYNGIAIHKGETTIVGNINKELVQKKINSKGKLIPLYRKKNLNQVWLVLIIGGVEKSSDFCLFDRAITTQEFESTFDRIFIYEFFDRKITELKIT
ncbi:MAG: hypothetical protein RI572_06410 [Salegentibacter sp.]|uniref:hypothetical protein n=1 Tax=Salegentibacter sp. TaxID=1903072 RepID=UPI0028709831|nr:hypothetical protein [Salegentibacter sp.]MDR9457026.1 hypothetical protein [Salegentibacter sp.]